MNIVFGLLKYLMDAALILLLIYIVLLIRKRID